MKVNERFVSVYWGLTAYQLEDRATQFSAIRYHQFHHAQSVRDWLWQKMPDTKWSIRIIGVSPTLYITTEQNLVGTVAQDLTKREVYDRIEGYLCLLQP